MEFIDDITLMPPGPVVTKILKALNLNGINRKKTLQLVLKDLTITMQLIGHISWINNSES